MLHRQTNNSNVSIDTTKTVQTLNKPSNSGVWLSLLKLLTISTVLIMSLTINSVLAYPAYSHSKPLPHRSVIYFAPKEDSVVKEFRN